MPVSKPAKRKLLAHKKSLIALAEKSTPIERKKQILVQHGGNFLSVLLPPVLRVLMFDSCLKMNHTRRMILVPENTFERLQQRQQILTPPVTQTLKNLDSQMGDILSNKQLDDEAKATLYNQVLQRYLTYYDQRKGQPLHVKLTTPKPVETRKPEESSEETSKESTAEAETTSAVEQEVIKSVPRLYKTGARQLLDKLKENSDVLNWNDNGELVYENKPISGSHMVDLVNDILRHRKGFEPVGWSVFARGLARMNVPENIVRNPYRQSAIREFKTRVREETPESPTRWLPTPPTTSSAPMRKQRRRVESPRPQAVRWLRL